MVSLIYFLAVVEEEVIYFLLYGTRLTSAVLKPESAPGVGAFRNTSLLFNSCIIFWLILLLFPLQLDSYGYLCFWNFVWTTGYESWTERPFMLTLGSLLKPTVSWGDLELLFNFAVVPER